MEKILKITEDQAKELYRESSDEFKRLLEMNFGKKTFCKSFKDAVNTYEDACEITEDTPVDENLLFKAGCGKSEVAFLKLKTIFKAANILNNNWKADFSDSSQYKYYPWFTWRSSGFRFYRTDYARTCTSVGSRLCCGKSEDAEYIGKRFEDLYNDYYRE